MVRKNCALLTIPAVWYVNINCANHVILTVVTNPPLVQHVFQGCGKWVSPWPHYPLLNLYCKMINFNHTETSLILQQDISPWIPLYSHYFVQLFFKQRVVGGSLLWENINGLYTHALFQM